MKDIKKMYLSGMSSPAIAAEVGWSSSKVRNKLKRLGVKMRSPSEAQNAAYKAGKKKTRYWLGKKQPKEAVAKRIAKTTGKGNGRWVDGMSRRGYRKVVEKHECEDCGSKIKLIIHHRNADHFDNDTSNLAVLCESCHNSLHVTLRHMRNRGETCIPKSNCKCGWSR